MLFAWPKSGSRVGYSLDWEKARLGLVCAVLADRPEDSIGSELLLIHDGERWSVPESWCRKIRQEPH